jgi:hypothetical protein
MEKAMKATNGKNMKITGGLLGLVFLFIGSSANAATVSINPGVINVAPGDVFSVDVLGTGFDNLVVGGSVSLSWDASVITLISTNAEVAGALSAGLNDLLLYSRTDSSLDLTAVAGFFDPGLGPDFAFLTGLTFQAALLPGGTDVALIQGSGGTWQDALGGEYTGVVYNSAAVTVGAVPVPAAVWLFASGLLGMVGVARRRAVV